MTLKSADELNERIIDTLKKNPGVSIWELAKQCGVEERRVSSALVSLESRDVLIGERDSRLVLVKIGDTWYD